MRRAPAAPQAPAPEPPARRALGPAAFGPLLIGAGTLFLVDRFAWALGIRSLLWALLFGVGAALFLLLYARDRRQWWALFPGFGLAALAAAVVAGNVGGGLLLGLAGAACVALYLRGGGRWLLLAGGALVSLAVMSVLEGAFPRLDNGWVLFAGLAVTLFLLYRRSPGDSPWGLYLAVAAAALALIAMFTVALVETLIAVALMAAGAAMVWFDRPAAPAPLAEQARPPGPAPVAASGSGPANGAAERTAAPVPPEPASGAAESVEDRVSRPLWARLRRGRR